MMLETKPQKLYSLMPGNLELAEDDGPSCTICLGGVPAPIQSGCGCRGDQGLAHVACRAEVAKQSGIARDWYQCTTCGLDFTGAMEIGLSEERVRFLADRPEDDMDRLEALSYLGCALARQGRYAEGELLSRETLATERRVLGTEHPQTLRTATVLASILCGTHKNAEAERLSRTTLAIQRRQHVGPEHLRIKRPLYGLKPLPPPRRWRKHQEISLGKLA